MDIRLKIAFGVVFFTLGVLLALFLRVATTFVWNNLPQGQADWIWIFALLAFTLLFILFTGNKNGLDRTDYRSDANLAGIKGGKTSRDSILGDEDDEE